MKVVKNTCYGGFGLSPKAQKEYLERKGFNPTFYNREHTDDLNTEYTRISFEEAQSSGNLGVLTTKEDLGENPDNIPGEKYFLDTHISRDDEILVEVVEELGDEADGDCADLRVTTIPDDVEYEISEYDGIETIREKHQKW